MKKRVCLFLVLMLTFSFLMSGCEDWDEETEDNETGTEETASGSAGAGQDQGNGPQDMDPEPISVGTDASSATILVYMNGSDLESDNGAASGDIAEMLSSGIGTNVNVLVETLGTRQWQDYDIASDTSQIYRIRKGKAELLEDDLGQLDCTEAKTLSDFISYGKKNYPADRYVLLFWDHGGGPVYGFGYDEWQDETSSLTLDEIREALSDNSDVRFDLIGMDCCIMASLETCYALAPYCRYAVLSEDFESGLGWAYTDWMRLFEENPGISTPLLGKKIIDGMIDANENDPMIGDSATMVLVNERAVPDLFDKWTAYAYRYSDNLLGSNYSKLHKAKGRGQKGFFDGLWSSDESDVTMDDYYVSDVLSIVESIGEEGKVTDDLKAALKACVAYFGHTSDKNELTGLAVSLPYGDPDYYADQAKIYEKCGIDGEYIAWLENFVKAGGSDNYYDYSDFEESWCGWGSYGGGWSSASCEDDWDDWEYDYEEQIWYMYEGDILYLYDDETNMMYCYDEYDDTVYYYDEDEDDWYPVEE